MLIGSQAWAAGAVPNAGSVAAGVNQEREWKPKADEPDVRVDLGKPDIKGSEVRIHVNRVHFTGQNLYPEQRLQALVASDIQGDQAVADLWKIAQKVTDFFHKEGYMTAVAYLPEQEIKDGVVTIAVVVGQYGEIGFDNKSELVTGRAVGLTHAARPGKFIRLQPLDRTLLILNDIPGVKAHAFLSPGKASGTANAVFRLTTTETDAGLLYTDNYGSRYTGRWRIGGMYHWNNVGHVGDQIQIGYLRSYNGGLNNYDLRYELPVGNDGTFAGLELFRTDYDLGQQYARYDAYGVSHGWKIYSRTPLKRTLNNNLYFHAEFSHTTLTDRIVAFNQDSEKQGNAFRFGLDGDSRNARSASSYKIMHTIGRIGMDNETARKDDMTLHSEGLFQKTELDLYHIQQLDRRLALHASLTAQYAWDNLDSSEKFYIGGYNAVRAFPQGEAGGDDGILGSLELRYQTPDPHWQLAAFYDAGWVRLVRDTSDRDNSRHLAGAGLGILWTQSGSSFARLDYAFPLSNRHSDTYGRDIGGTWWFQFMQRI
jgi:hemolysin activation/secretion protein